MKSINIINAASIMIRNLSLILTYFLTSFSTPPWQCGPGNKVVGTRVRDFRLNGTHVGVYFCRRLSRNRNLERLSSLTDIRRLQKNKNG